MFILRLTSALWEAFAFTWNLSYFSNLTVVGIEQLSVVFRNYNKATYTATFTWVWAIHLTRWKRTDAGGHDSYLKSTLNSCFVKAMREVAAKVRWTGMDPEKDFDAKRLNNSLNHLRFWRWTSKPWNFDDFETQRDRIFTMQGNVTRLQMKIQDVTSFSVTSFLVDSPSK